MSVEKIINDAWENKNQVNQDSDRSLKDAVNQVINDLDNGKSRVAEKINGNWVTHQYLKKAIMLSFRIYPMENLNGPYSSWYDKSHLLKAKQLDGQKKIMRELVSEWFQIRLLEKALLLARTLFLCLVM